MGRFDVPRANKSVEGLFGLCVEEEIGIGKTFFMKEISMDNKMGEWWIAL